MRVTTRDLFSAKLDFGLSRDVEKVRTKPKGAVSQNILRRAFFEKQISACFSFLIIFCPSPLEVCLTIVFFPK